MIRGLEGLSSKFLQWERNTPDNSMNFRDWLRTRNTEGYKSIACYSISGWCQPQAISPFKRSSETGLKFCAVALWRGEPGRPSLDIEPVILSLSPGNTYGVLPATPHPPRFVLHWPQYYSFTERLRTFGALLLLLLLISEHGRGAKLLS